MKKKLNKLFVFLLLCQLHVSAQSEGYNYEATTKPVDSSGFYNIVLTPELNAHLKIDCSDLRIVNDTGKWVPHLVRRPNSEVINLPLLLYINILKNETINNATEIVMEAGANIISDLVFTINSSSAERYCTLTGSDDMKSWFIINDSIKVVGETESYNGTTTFTLRFPPVNYRFFKVNINNHGKEGFKMLAVATSVNESLPGKYYRLPSIENPPPKISKQDSSKLSFIKIEQSAAYHFNQIALRVSGVKYFNRKAKLYIPSSANHSFSNPGSFVADLDISNNSTLQFRIPVSNARTFYIIIQNDDNLPLKIDEVKTFIDSGVATVYLERSGQYKLLLDNPTASAPNYDLTIKDIPSREKISSVTFSNIIALAKPAVVSKQYDNSKKLIWFAIAIAAVVLGFFTYRLINDMNRSKS